MATRLAFILNKHYLPPNNKYWIISSIVFRKKPKFPYNSCTYSDWYYVDIIVALVMAI